MVTHDGSDDVTRHLQWHAGIVDEGARPGRSISAHVAWDGKIESGLEQAVCDCIGVLSQLNIELNGRNPGEGAEGAATCVPRPVAYAVAEILRLLRTGGVAGPRAPLVETAAWRIETAWLAVLAGDIEDIASHVAEEQRAREE